MKYGVNKVGADRTHIERNKGTSFCGRTLVRYRRKFEKTSVCQRCQTLSGVQITDEGGKVKEVGTWNVVMADGFVSFVTNDEIRAKEVAATHKGAHIYFGDKKRPR